MSKVYKINMNIDVSKLRKDGGLAIYYCAKEKDPKNPNAIFDPRGYKERTGPEVFALMCGAAIGNANQRGNLQQIRGYRKITKGIEKSCVKGEHVANKTEIELVTKAIENNPGWPNTDETLGILDQILAKLKEATEINENPDDSETED